MKDRIDDYWDLSPAERREVEQFVKDHPEFRPQLADAMAFAAMIESTAGKEVDEEDVARYVSRDLFGAAAGMSAEEVEAVEAELERNPELRELAETYRQRSQDLVAHDPVAHFESLRQTSAPKTEARARREDRTPVRRPRARRIATAAVFVLLAFVAGAAVLDVATTSRLDRLAAFEADEVERGNYEYTTRSAGGSSAVVDTLFLDALDVLKNSQRSYLGFFRSHDLEAMQHAEKGLREFVDRYDEESYLTLEARYLIAKIMIHEGRLHGATSELRTVVDEGGARTSRARELLAELEESP